MIASKSCRVCGVVRPFAEFYQHPSMADGHLNICKVCIRADRKRRYQADPDRFREIERQRYHTDARRKAAAHKAATEWIARNPEKHRANTAVGNAIRDGRLKRGPCEVCGTLIRVHGHHDDYSQPLKVRWLCAVHHRQHHVIHGPAD